MKTRRICILLMICLFSLFLITSVPHLASAQSQAQSNASRGCRNIFTGTYLTTIADGKGQFASRGVITFSADGNFFVTDSNQGGVEGVFNPFGDTQGTYVCTSNQEIRAVGINFGFSGRDGVNDIARSDIRATVARQSGALQGSITVTSFALNADPLASGGSVVGTFQVTGQLINAN
jgi:hypothetical protein